MKSYYVELALPERYMRRVEANSPEEACQQAERKFGARAIEAVLCEGPYRVVIRCDTLEQADAVASALSGAVVEESCQ